MVRIITLLLSFTVLGGILSETVFAREWQNVPIPNSVCGDGSAYSVFISKGSSEKLLIEFMGGGACWSLMTCEGPDFHTWIHPIPEIPAYSTLTAESVDHPWNRATVIFVPYCTGDVHAGHHIAQYMGIDTVHHVGYNNVINSLNHLSQKHIVDFRNFQDVTVWGASGGAIGSFVHASNIERYLNPTAKKTLIADSPGLHFGKTFWHKFTNLLLRDYNEAFGHIGLRYQDNGFLAPFMGPVFENLKNWQIGILQSTRDVVMSKIFGDISMEDHQDLVLSPEGIAQVAKQYPNVKTWIPDTMMHTFLLLPESASIQDATGKTALGFAEEVYFSNFSKTKN